MSGSSHSDLQEKEIVSAKSHSEDFSEEREDNFEASRPPLDEKYYGSNDDIRPDEVAHDAIGAPLSTVPSKHSVTNIKSVPNGGTKAWLQVLGGFFIFFNTWGIVNAFGIYQSYYETGLLQTSSPSDISWIGSVSAFLLMITGIVAGPIYDMGYAHQLLLGGSFLIVLGQMMLSLCHTYWQVFLAQGVTIGLGTGAIFVSGVAILSTYWSTKLAATTGLAAAGSSIGGMLYPIIFYKLQPHIGFAWATRVLGFVALSTLAVSNLCMRVRVVPTVRRSFLDLPAWKELPYLFFNLGTFFAFFGMYTVFFYIQLYCLQEGIMGANLAFYSLAVVNAASTFGRVLPNFLADRIGPMNVMMPCAFVCGITQYGLIGAHSTASVMVIAVLYGFFSGTLVSLPPTIYVAMAGPKNRGKIGTRMGMGFAFVSVGILTGTPITGAILDNYGFKYVWVFGGTFLTFGSFILALARFAQGGWKLWVKV